MCASRTLAGKHNPTTMREFKFHEQRLLKKVNLYNYKNDGNLREIQVMRRYNILKREDYH
jgi:U3 small nucleolar ribonucleoprotein protein IMP3